ncbi:hypothetical protein BSNK01_32010 [Bacillaceae bacterium]
MFIKERRLKMETWQPGRTAFAEGAEKGTVQPHERIEVLDAMRGLALFGILLVNMSNVSSPDVYWRMAGIERAQGSFDNLAEWAVHLFAEGKFYPLFSLLFGAGMWLFFTRTEKATAVIC